MQKLKPILAILFCVSWLALPASQSTSPAAQIKSNVEGEKTSLACWKVKGREGDVVRVTLLNTTHTKLRLVEPSNYQSISLKCFDSKGAEVMHWVIFEGAPPSIGLISTVDSSRAAFTDIRISDLESVFNRRLAGCRLQITYDGGYVKREFKSQFEGEIHSEKLIVELDL